MYTALNKAPITYIHAYIHTLKVPRAYVVKQPNCPSDFSADDVIEYIHARVAPYKRLRGTYHNAHPLTLT